MERQHEDGEKKQIGKDNSCSREAELAGIFLPPPQLQSTHRTPRVTALLPWRLTPSNATSGACVCSSVNAPCCASRGVRVRKLNGRHRVSQSHVADWCLQYIRLFGIYHRIGFCVRATVSLCVEECNRKVLIEQQPAACPQEHI